MRYKIKELRKEKKMTQKELAYASGVSRAIISKLENGEAVTTSTSTLSKIANTLNVKVSDILLD